MTRSLAVARVASTARVRATDWLLYDQFNVSAAAPLASPRTCEPGPGTLTLVQTDGQFSIVAGQLVFPTQTTPVWGDQGIITPSTLTNVVGRTLLATIRLTSGSLTVLAWKEAANLDIQAGAGNRYFINLSATSNTIHVGVASVSSFSVGDWVTNQAYRLAISRRSAGAFMLIKGGAFTEWTLLWVATEAMADSLYPVLSNLSGVGTLDNLKVADLDAPWNTDFGISVQRLSGSVAAGTSFTHEADCLIEYTVTAVSSGADMDVLFRIQDASNYWRLRVNNAGGLILAEVVAGTPTTRGSVAGVVANGDRVVIVAAGSTIRVYEANTLRITYASATNFATATAGEVDTLGTGGVVSDLISWPRTLSNQPLRALEAVANA